MSNGLKRTGDLLGAFFFTQSQGRFTAMEGLRAWALFMIFNVHFLGVYESRYYFLNEGGFFHRLFSMVNAGHSGVDLFFLLSGFLIYTTIQRKRPAFWRFLGQRAQRLYPALLVVNLPLVAMQAKDIPTAIDNLLLLGLFPGTDLFNAVEWALTYQLYFYVLAGVWLVVLARWPFSLSWAFYWLLVVVIYAQLFAGLIDFHAAPRFMSMVWGLGLAKLYAQSELWARCRPALVWAWLPGLALLYGARWSWTYLAGPIVEIPWMWAAYFSAIDLSFLLIIASLLTGASRLQALLNLRPLRMVGAMSYSAFLVHGVWGIPLAGLMVNGLSPSLPTLLLHYLLSWVVTLLSAALLFNFMEKPYFTRQPSPPSAR